MTNTDPRAGAVCTGQRYLVVADLVTFTVIGADTQGAYSIFEMISPPRGGPPVLHTHPQQETLYIVEGEYLVSTLQGSVLQTLHLGPGGVAHIPGGLPHTFKNIGAAQGKLLAVLAPSGIEYAFAELGVPVAASAAPPPQSEPIDLERLMTVLARHHMTFVAPPVDEAD